MTKQEEQKLRETINLLLPLQELDKYLKKIARNVLRVRRDRNDHAQNKRPKP